MVGRYPGCFPPTTSTADGGRTSVTPTYRARPDPDCRAQLGTERVPAVVDARENTENLRHWLRGFPGVQGLLAQHVGAARNPTDGSRLSLPVVALDGRAAPATRSRMYFRSETAGAVRTPVVPAGALGTGSMRDDVASARYRRPCDPTVLGRGRVLCYRGQRHRRRKVVVTAPKLGQKGSPRAGVGVFARLLSVRSA